MPQTSGRNNKVDSNSIECDVEHNKKNGRNFNIRRLSIEIDAVLPRMRESYYISHSMIKKGKKCPPETSTQRYLLCHAMGYR